MTEDDDDLRQVVPRVTLRGRFLISEAAITETERLLPTFRGPDGDHEGLVFLAGCELDEETTLLCTAVAPDCEHSRGRVMADAAAVGDAARAARRLDLAILAQVHSHPGALTMHSLGDDSMVLLPFERMLSIVVPRYGHRGMRPLHGIGVHQFQNGRWRLARARSARDAITVVPAGVDLR